MDEPVNKISLWRAGLKSFEAHWREWGFMALIFFFILAALHGISANYMGPLQVKMQELRVHKDPHAVGEFFRDNAWEITAFTGIMLFVLFIQRYLYFSFFMKRELSDEAQKPS